MSAYLNYLIIERIQSIQLFNYLNYFQLNYLNTPQTNLSSNLNSLLIGIPTNNLNKFSTANLCLFKPLMALKPGLAKGAFNQ